MGQPRALAESKNFCEVAEGPSLVLVSFQVLWFSPVLPVPTQFSCGSAASCSRRLLCCLSLFSLYRCFVLFF